MSINTRSFVFPTDIQMSSIIVIKFEQFLQNCRFPAMMLAGQKVPAHIPKQSDEIIAQGHWSGGVIGRN